MTYSIVARDPESGQMGVAVQSHWFSVGSVVGWGQAGVGVVATQALVEPAYGPRGLERMRAGGSAPDTLAELLAQDGSAGVRQVAMVDAQGRVGAHTGSDCIRAAGHETGEGFSCQANMMWNDTVWGAMAEAFRAGAGDGLKERLLAALQAAQAERGDIRGVQSAAILVVGASETGDVFKDRPVDLRVEDHPDPLGELARLLRLHEAYEHMERFDLAQEAGDQDEAWRQVEAAEALAPDNIEVVFWKAVALATSGEIERARELLGRCSAEYPGWPELLRRLPESDLFPDDPELMGRLLD